MVTIPVVVDVGSLRSREDVERFLGMLKSRDVSAEEERARMLGRIKNSRTDVRERG